MKRFSRIPALFCALLALLAAAAFCACDKKGPSATLTLSAGQGGALFGTEYAVTVGANVADALADIAPTPEDGLEFAGWYEGEQALARDRVMPAEGLSLTAKYYAAYTVSVWLQDENGAYPAEPSVESGKALYGEAFSYVPAPHTALDPDKPNSVTSDALGKHETFSAWVKRETVAVTYVTLEPVGLTIEPLGALAVPYGGTATLAAPTVVSAAERSYRFAGWATVPNGAPVYRAGDTVPDVTEPFALYACWEVGYRDFYGGDDVLYPSSTEAGVLTLQRFGFAEKRGTYDADSGLFSFSDNGAVILEGKLLDTVFYYYRDTLEQVYPDCRGGDAALELGPHGGAVWTDAAGKRHEGAYDIDEATGTYRFSPSDGTGVAFDFVLAIKGGALCYLSRGDEAGDYLPAAQERALGVITYRLDGFGGGQEIYAASDPLVVGDAQYVRIPLEYRVIDSGDGFVTYRLTSFVTDDYPVNTFDFRIGPSSDDAVKGVFARGDGLTGLLYPDRMREEEGETFRLDGFGAGTMGDENGTYTVQTEQWILASLDDEGTLSYDYLYDVWVTFTAASGTTVDFRPRSYGIDDALDYAPLDTQGLFGTYTFPGGIVYGGKTFEEAILYVWQGWSEAAAHNHYAALLGKIGEAAGETIWVLLDYNYDYALTPDDGGVYTLYMYGTRFTVDNGAHTAELVAAQEPTFPDIVFFDDESGRLSMTPEGDATYAPAGGNASPVGYVLEYGMDPLAGVFRFDIDGKERLFAYYYDATETQYRTVEVTRVLTEDPRTGDTILLYFAEYAAVGFAQEDGSYYYPYVGVVYEDEAEEGVFTFSADSYDYTFDSGRALEQGFRFETDGSSYRIRLTDPVRLSGNGDRIELDGYGNAVYTENGVEKQWLYDVAFAYDDAEGNEFVALYLLVDPDDATVYRFFTATLNESDPSTGTFAVIADNREVLLLGELVGMSDEIFIDGNGMGYYIGENTLTGTITVSSCPYLKRTGAQGRTEYVFEEFGLTIAVLDTFPADPAKGIYISSGAYVEKDEAQEGRFSTTDGGSLSGDGYGLYADGSVVDLATYTDPAGKVYDGVMEIGTLEDDSYNLRRFTRTAAGDVIRFVALSRQADGSYADTLTIYFDLIGDADGETVADPRTEYFGAYRLYDAGRPTDAYIYLDGHGKADVFDKKGKRTGSGTVSYDAVVDAFRYCDGENDTVFLFRLYSETSADAIAYSYATYAPESVTETVAEDWSYLSLDGFVRATHVGRYGDVTTGRYGMITDWLVVLYPDDGSPRMYFELGDATFGIPDAPDGFITRGGVLYAYTGDETSVRIPDGVTSIYAGVFADTLLSSVDLNGVLDIGDEAFFGSSLAAVSSGSVRTVGIRAFANITDLATVDLPAATEIGAEAFFDSRVTSFRFCALAEVGDRAFAHNITVETTTLDLSGLADANSVVWGADLFSTVVLGEIANGTIDIRILLSSVEAVNALYGNDAFAKVKNRIGIVGTESGEYYDLRTGKGYMLAGGVLSEIGFAWNGAMIPAGTVGLCTVETGSVTLWTLLGDGTGYEKQGEIGTLDSIKPAETVLLAVGRELTFDADGKAVSLTLGIAVNTAHNGLDCTVALEIDGRAVDATIDAAEGALHWTEGGDAYFATFPEVGVCSVKTAGEEFLLESEPDPVTKARYRVTFGSKGGSLTIIRYELGKRYPYWDGDVETDRWDYEAITDFTVVAVDDTTFRVIYTYYDDDAYMYVTTIDIVTYMPEPKSVTVEKADESIETVDGVYSGDYPENYSPRAEVFVDADGKITSVYRFRIVYGDYAPVLSCEQTEENTFRVTADLGDGVKTYVLAIDLEKGKFTWELVA